MPFSPNGLSALADDLLVDLPLSLVVAIGAEILGEVAIVPLIDAVMPSGRMRSRVQRGLQNGAMVYAAVKLMTIF